MNGALENKRRLQKYKIQKIVKRHVAVASEAKCSCSFLDDKNHFEPAASCMYDQGRSQDFEFRGLKPMASAEREPITGVWGQSPQRVQGQSPW